MLADAILYQLRGATLLRLSEVLEAFGSDGLTLLLHRTP